MNFFKSIATITITLLASIICYSQNDQLNGSATGIVGTSYVYYYQSSNTDEFFSPQWIIVNGTLISSSLTSSNSRASATIRWDSPGTGSVTLKDGGVTYGAKNVTVSCQTLGSPTFTSQSICNSVSTAVTASPGAGASTVRWYANASGGTKLFEGTSYNVSLATTTTYYISSAYSTSSTCESSRVPITITVYAAVNTATVSNQNGCSGFASTLTASPGSNGNVIRWYDASSGGNLLATSNTFTTPILSQTVTYYAESYNTTTGCKAPTRAPLTVTVATSPVQPVGIADEVIYGSGSTSITATPPGANTIKWYTVGSGGTSLSTGITYTTPVLTSSTQYYIASYDAGNNCESVIRTPINVTVSPLISPSSVSSEIIRVAGIKKDIDTYTLTDLQKSKQVSYFDGLMRTFQQVGVKGSQNGKDVVAFAEYDAQGRSSKSYLPYVATTTNGSLQQQYKADQLTFYNASNDKIANDASPFAVGVFEDSPIGRLMEQGSIGAAWQPGLNPAHTQRMKYTFNAASEVRRFKPDGTSTGFFAANILNKTEFTNEDGNVVIIFSNTQGQTLLKKVQLDEVINGVTVSYLETYYIYDEFGRMKYTISPKGVSALQSNGWSLTQALLDQYVYQYKYDSRGRVIEKKVPGVAWVYYAYDDLDRLVLTQDGSLRASNKWFFIKYDQKGRTVMQGLYVNATQNTRALIQTLLDGLYVSTNATYPANAFYENRGNALHGYSNTSFPKTNADNTALEVWNVMYYESHDFNYDGTRDNRYDSLSFSGSGQATTSNWRVKGLPTGSKRLVPGTSTWLYTYVFFDNYNRVIQTKTNNHLSSTVDNVSTVVYDFEGKVLATKTYHNAGGGKTSTIVNRYSYYPQGRLWRIYQNNNGAANDQLVVQYEYNELGQVVDKKLHETAVGNQIFLQSVDFRYTIRGQLNSINNAQLTSDAVTNDETTDYFGMELLYNTVESGLANNSYFNGNISAVKWKGIGDGSGTTDQRSYKFSYDKINRLETATSQQYSGSSWTKESGANNESMSYDHNGNIISLQRNQRKHQLAGTVASYISEQIDNLTYTYSSTIGDQLLKVEDAIVGTIGKAGFDNGTSGTNSDYTYDLNGNLLTDANKAITSNITYNIQGKPSLITFTDGRKLEYVYDASGSKLTMKTYATNGTLQTTTDYVGSFVYENGVLSFFSMPEGRVIKNGSNLEYQYAIADHQGNTRVVFTAATPAPVAPQATFEGDSNDGGNQYLNVNGSFVVPNGSANHTTGGSVVVKMNQTYKIGPAKSVKVYPGDKIDMEVWEYHEGSSGFGTTSTPLTNLITSVAGVLGGVSGGPGESGLIYNSVNTAITNFGTGGNKGDSRPAAYLNFILVDKNYNVLDAGWLPAPAATFTKQKISFPTKTMKEEGYIYVWLSYDDDSNNWVYFDDFKVTHTKSNIIQYNEYYPFGLQTSNSWTRDSNTNNFLYNEGSELNKNTGWYETFFRGYDATLGRFHQVDPLAQASMSLTPYHYSFNNPLSFNDPNGDYPSSVAADMQRVAQENAERGPTLSMGAIHVGMGSGIHWSDQYRSFGSGGNTILIDIDQLSDGAHLFDFNNGHLTNYTYYSDAQILDMGISTLGSIIGSNSNATSDYTGGARLWGDEAGTVFTTDPNSKVHVDGKKGRSMTIGEAFAPLGGALLDGVQFAFDVVGLVPGAGELFDLVNAGIYGLRGDKLNAGLSLAGAVPFLGYAATGTKLLTKGSKALHQHHVLSQTFRPWFKSRGISNIDDFTIAISEATHLKGVHGKGLGNLPGQWNKHWADFIKQNPNATPSEIFHQAEGMLKRFGLEHLPYLKY